MADTIVARQLTKAGKTAFIPSPKMASKYEMVIYWSEDDNAFIVEIPELPGCMADGPSYREAVANAELVIEQWLEVALELGRFIPTSCGRLMFT